MMAQFRMHLRRVMWDGGNGLYTWEGQGVEWVIHRRLHWPRLKAAFVARTKPEPGVIAKSVMSEKT